MNASKIGDLQRIEVTENEPLKHIPKQWYSKEPKNRHTDSSAFLRYLVSNQLRRQGDGSFVIMAYPHIAMISGVGVFYMPRDA